MALHWKILIGLLLGVVWTIVSILLGIQSFTLNWIAPWGEIFLKLLKLIAIPLVMFSIITGVAGLADLSKLGRMGGKTLLIYAFTTLIAVSLGLFLVNFLNPGSQISEQTRVYNRLTYELWLSQNPEIPPVDTIRFIENPTYSLFLTDSTFASYSRTQTNPLNKIIESTEEARPLDFLIEMVPDNIINSLSSNSLLLQVIFFSIFLGIALKRIPQQFSERLLFFFEGFNQVYLVMIDMVMSVSPFFVFCLMAGNMTEMAGDDLGGLFDLLSVLMHYAWVVLLGLFILLGLIYPTCYALCGYHLPVKRSFFQRYVFFFKSMGPAQLLAFSTSSSAATLPLTLECAQKGLKVSKETTSFVLPIGATVNMDGTSLYQAIAVVFLAQLHCIDLTLGQQITVVLTATLASIGSAAVPSAGLIMLIMVVQSVGLNPAWIAIILPIDRLLDMVRTVVNVSGDGLVSSLIERWEQNNRN